MSGYRSLSAFWLGGAAIPFIALLVPPLGFSLDSGDKSAVLDDESGLTLESGERRAVLNSGRTSMELVNN